MYFLRHGLTDYNSRNKWMGQRDIPLNPTGVQQIHEIIPSLEILNLEAIYTSPLSRAKQSSEIIAENIGIPVYEVYDLRERDLGSFEGSQKTIEKRKMMEKNTSVESMAEVVERVKNAFEGIGRHQCALVVSHSAIYRCIVNCRIFVSSSPGSSISNAEFVCLHEKRVG